MEDEEKGRKGEEIKKKILEEQAETNYENKNK